jgi:hypothetical protein
MDETRESCLAAILVRGLMRVRQRAELTGHPIPPSDDQPQPCAANASPADHQSVDHAAAVNDEGEQR